MLSCTPYTRKETFLFTAQIRDNNTRRNGRFLFAFTNIIIRGVVGQDFAEKQIVPTHISSYVV